jgi:hypothetical protein
MTLAEFRATRHAPPPDIDPNFIPSDAPATEEYVYDAGDMIWWVRCEAGRYYFSWTHPAGEYRATLAEAEEALFADLEAEGVI